MTIESEKVILKVIKKEYERLLKVSTKAKAEVDEHISIGSEMIAIHEEFKSIVESKLDADNSLERLSKLQKRRDRLNKVAKKDLIRLMDAQNSVENDVRILASEIAKIELKIGLYEKN